MASPERVEDIAFVSLAPEAEELFVRHRTAVEHDLVDPEDDRSWLSKLPGHVLRIAGTLHALAHGLDGGPIGEHVMRSALAWVPYLRAHAAHVGAVAGEDPAASVAERVLSWTRRRRRSRFSRRDAFDAVRGAACPRVETIDPALMLLEDRGWIRRMLEQPRDAGRPPSPVFMVNPGPQNPQNPQNPADDPSCSGCAGSAGTLGSEREAAQASGAGEQSDQGEHEAGIDGKDGEPGWIA